MNIILSLQNVAHASRLRCPPDVAKIQLYGEARGGYINKPFPFMGMRRFVVDYLSQPITKEMIDDAQRIASPDFDRKMWDHILEEHCGYLPIQIIGLPEGEIGHPGEVLWTVESHDEKCALLPMMIDKLVNSHVWFESTICQRLKDLRDTIESHCQVAGISAKYATYLAGGTTQLGDDYLTSVVNSLIFMYFPQGLDSNSAKYLNSHYHTNYNATTTRITDHNSIIMWDDESAALDHLLEIHSHEWFSILCDTHSYGEFLDEVLPLQVETIVNRSNPMSIAIDSADYERAFKYAISSLERLFGVSYNHKGFKRFDAPIILCQIEDLTAKQIKEEVGELIENKWSPLSFFWHISDHYIQENLSRSTNGFISKVCHVQHKSGLSRDVCKSPIEDPDKKTRKGRQEVREPYVYFNCGHFSHESILEVRKRLLK